MTSINHTRFTGIALVLSIVMMTLFAGCAGRPAITATYGAGEQPFVLAAGSLGGSGLIEALSEAFARSESATVQLVTMGSGESLALLKSGRVDAVLVHAPALEKKAVQEGWAVNRTLIGANRFFILGPRDDPAQIGDALCSLDAFRRIHRSQATFISPGDRSETHKKEITTWQRARVRPWGHWYVTSGTMMTASLNKADEMGGYFLTDSSTWAVKRNTVQHLTVLFQGSKDLIDTYHILLSPPGATPGHDTAAEFVSFVTSEQGQRIIRDYGKNRFGVPLYQDAAFARRSIEQ